MNKPYGVHPMLIVLLVELKALRDMKMITRHSRPQDCHKKVSQHSAGKRVGESARGSDCGLNRVAPVGRNDCQKKLHHDQPAFILIQYMNIDRKRWV